MHSDNSNNDDSSSSSFFSSSSSYYKELEKDILTRGLTNNDSDFLYTDGRALIVLGDFFYDNETGRDYERGIMLKGKRDFIGKTIVLSRNSINHLLTTCCTVSGLGVYRVSYSVSWTGKSEKEAIQDLLSQKRSNPHTFSLDLQLCWLLQSQPVWKYMIADLEQTNDETAILLG